MKTHMTILLIIASGLFLFSCQTKPEIDGELKKWHKVTISFQGPELDETGEENPFLDYRMEATFTNGEKTYKIPGFFAADGNAAESGASKGNVWQVRFTPDIEGIWTYQVSFRKGDRIAINQDVEAGKPVAFDGATGEFVIGPTDKSGNDFRGKGKLNYVDQRYLQFAETNEYFLKGGADSPENFLAYKEFDGTRDIVDNEAREGEAPPPENLHEYAPHIQDWNEGDPTWMGGNGKGIIGALNYLASEGMNSVYFLTMNIEGDGKDVWPYVSPDDFTRFDCSKLDQWEIVFTHMDSLGLMLHFVLQETENELLLNNGDTGLERMLYYRELIARFSHHLAITWNMGEENGPADFTPDGQTTEQQKAMARYMKKTDPYNNFVVIHTHANPKFRNEIFNNLLGYEYLNGPSIQIGNLLSAHAETKIWIEKSKEAGKPWIVNIDEIGPAWRGVDPDDREPHNNQDSVRRYVLWANLMSGGGGVEWYFGYKNHNNDLNCEDWRSRDMMWDYTKHAIDFFRIYLPFSEMESADYLITNANAYCYAKKGEIYVVYLPEGGTSQLDMTDASGTYEVFWYSPREGGNLKTNTITEFTGGEIVELGEAPEESLQDWAVLIRKK